MADPGAHRLSARLRRDLRFAPDAARAGEFLDALAMGLLPWEAYADLTAQHWFLYESLELAARTMADDPVARTFVFPELVRLPSLEADLRFLHGPRWSAKIAALPATTTYCARLRYAANSHPIGFVAHHYTRYLGDLSRGRALGHAIARAYGFVDDGHRFFAFGDLDAEAFKTYYGQLLDTVPWSRYEQDEFVTEVLEAGRLNIAVHDDLRQRWT